MQNCLYIDPAPPAAVRIGSAGESHAACREVQEGLGDTKAIIRVVRTPEDMAEKLRIFDCGLDDRVVEIVRLLMVTQLTEQTPDLLESSPVFSAPHGEPQLTCLCHDGSERVCPITAEGCNLKFIRSIWQTGRHKIRWWWIAPETMSAFVIAEKGRA